MKSYADKKRRATEHDFRIGDRVLMDQTHNKKVINKTLPKFSNVAWTVTGIKGSMITVCSGMKTLTRNASLFKRVSSKVGRASNLEVIPNRSSRVSKPLVRFEAGPASGRINKR